MFNGFLKVMQKNYGNINRRIARAIINTEEIWPKSDSNNFFQSMFIQVALFFIFACQEGFVLRCTEIKAEQNIGSFKSQLQEKQSYNSLCFFFFFAFSYSSSSCAQREMEKKVWELNSSTRRARYSMCILIFLTFLYTINILTPVEDHFTKSLH